VAGAVAVFGLTRTMLQCSLAALALGVAMGLAFTSIGALIAEVVPPAGRGLAMGGYNACLYLGMMLGAAIMGGTVAGLGMSASFIMTGLVVIASTGGFILLLRNFSRPTP
jgi:MFS family permease